MFKNIFRTYSSTIGSISLTQINVLECNYLNKKMQDGSCLIFHQIKYLKVVFFTDVVFKKKYTF